MKGSGGVVPCGVCIRASLTRILRNCFRSNQSRCAVFLGDSAGQEYDFKARVAVLKLAFDGRQRLVLVFLVLSAKLHGQ